MDFGHKQKDLERENFEESKGNVPHTIIHQSSFLFSFNYQLKPNFGFSNIKLLIVISNWLINFYKFINLTQQT